METRGYHRADSVSFDFYCSACLGNIFIYLKLQEAT